MTEKCKSHSWLEMSCGCGLHCEVCGIYTTDQAYADEWKAQGSRKEKS